MDATTAIQTVSPSDTVVAPPDNIGSLPTSAKATPGVAARVISQAGTQSTVPGGAAQFFVDVLNDGSDGTTPGSPVTLTFHVPSGLTFAGVSEMNTRKGLMGFPGTAGSPAGTAWVCSPSAQAVVCTYRTGGKLASLPGGATIALIVRFNVSSSFKPAANGTKLSLRASLSAPGNRATTDQSVTAATTVSTTETGPELFPDIEAETGIQGGGVANERLEFINVGAGPAASISLSNVLPPGLVSGWKSTGTGWSCSGGQESSPSCSYAGTLAAGAQTPRLTLTYDVSESGVDALKLPTGGRSATSNWTIGISGRGVNGKTTASTYPSEVLVDAKAGSDLRVEARTAGGVDELLPGSTKSTVDVDIANLGQGAASSGLVVDAVMPSNLMFMSMTEKAPAGAAVPWTCTSSATVESQQLLHCTPTGTVTIPPARTLHLAMNYEAAPNARPETGNITFTAQAENQDATAHPSLGSVPVFVLQSDVGFPSLVLQRSTSPVVALAPATDGAPAAIETGSPFTEELDVRNSGGAAMEPASDIALYQRFGPGVKIDSVRAPADWHCTETSGTTPTLDCTVTLGAAVDPAATIPGPTVTVTPTRATPAGTDWGASVRLTAAGSPKARDLPVLVTVAQAKPSLFTDLSTDLLPTAGGLGKFTVTVKNDGDRTTNNPVSVGLRAPRGALLTTIDATGWNCETAPNKLTGRCTSRQGDDFAGETLSPIHTTLSFGSRTAGKKLTLSAHANDGTGRALGEAKAAELIVPRSTLRAIIDAPNKVVFDDMPLVRANEPLTPTTVTLEGDGSGGSGLGLTYTWTQRCLSSSDAATSGGRCTSITPRVTWLNEPAGTTSPATADAEFTAPVVSKLTVLVFQLTVSDGSASASEFVRVKDLPDPSASTGFALQNDHPVKVSEGVMSEKEKIPAPAEVLRGAGSRTPVPKAPVVKKKSLRLEHSLNADPVTTTTTATTTSTTTTTTGTTTTTSTTGTTTTSAASNLPAIFCSLIKDAAKGKSFSQSLPGGIELNLSGVDLMGTGCLDGTTLSFSDSSVVVSSVLKLTGVAGDISKNGITITAGTLEGPPAWNSPSLSLKDGSSLTLPFGSGSGSSDVALEGAVSGSGLAFIPLPSGWTATTTLTFQSGGGSTSATLSSDAIGPGSDTSPDSERPTIAIAGAVSSDGTFSLTADLQRIVQLQGSPVALSGSVKRETPDGPVSIAIKGSLTAPITITPGLTIKTLELAIAPTADSLGLTGEGVVELSGASGSLGVGVKLAYDNPKNWSLTATGTGTSSWSPVPGLTLSPSDVTGAIAAKDDKYEFSLKATPQGAWTPTSSVSVSNLSLTVGNTCPDTGAPCPTTGASIFMDLSGNVAVTLPSVGTVKTSLRGVLALPGGAFSVAATLAEPLNIGGGISIDSTKIELSKGMALPAGTASLTSSSVDPQGLQVRLTGSATLPVFGKVPSIEASYSSAGWAVAAQLGSYTLPGASGDGSKLSDSIVGWSSFNTSLKVTDPITKVVTTLPIPAGTFQMTGSFATPSWLKTTLKLPADVSGRASGSINTSTGDFALKMEFNVPSTTYLYGSATTSTNIKLAGVYVSLEKKGVVFNIAMGGRADLNVAATSTLPASFVNLTLEVGYSPTTQTVTGSFSLDSPTGWQNAFGARDLTLNQLAVTFQLNLATLVPGIGFGAKAILPGTITNPLGVPSGTQTTLVANISLTNPCLGIQITDPTNTGKNVLSVGNGVLTAKQFELQIAPSGCTVGVFKYAPGLSLNFDGAIAGVKVAVAARLGFSPFAFDGQVKIGAFSAGGLTLNNAQLNVSLSAGKVNIGFLGDANILGTNVHLEGSYAQNGTTTVADFKGSLDKLSIANVVTLNKIAVTAHIETGATSKLSFTAKGSVDLLGSTASADIALSMANGALTEAKANIVASINVGGTNGLKLDGTFNLDYSTSRPFTLDATVKASAGGVPLTDAVVSIKPGAVNVTATVGLNGVFSARITGAAYYGTVPAGTKIAGPNGTQVNAQPGDFLLSAKDVTLTFGGYKTVGTVEVGRAAATPWVNVGAVIQLLGTGSENSIAVKGTFSGNGDFSLFGTGNLNVVGISSQVTASVARTGSALAITGRATLSGLGSNIAVAGTFNYDNGSPRYRLTGSGNVSLGGYSIANAQFNLSNFPEDAGLSAQVNVNAGSSLSFSGRLSIVGGLYYMSASSKLNLSVLQADANVVFTNCNLAVTAETIQYQAQSIQVMVTNTFLRILNRPLLPVPTAPIPKCGSALGVTKLNASANFSSGGFSFGVNVNVDSNGNFSATAQSPSSGEYHGETGTLTILVVAFYADLNYHMSATIQSGSPRLSVSGSGSANIYGRTWTPFSWNGWGKILGAGLSFQTNPFKACAYVNVWGKNFGGCINGP